VKFDENLTERERQVSNLVMQGMLNKQIALQLGISERTVEFHLNNIYSKLQINSRVELAVHLVKSTVDSEKDDLHNDSQLTAKARRAKALKKCFRSSKRRLSET
jgi:DNA-binding CsgD family transcriptional regulator